DAYTQGRIVERDALVARIQSVLDKAYEVDSALVQARPDDAFNDAGPHGVVDPEVERDWSTMSDAERRAVLEHMARELADKYGVDDFDVIIEDLEDRDGKDGDDDPSLDYHGFWSEDDKGLHLDSNELSDPDLINTMAHEVRHAAQHEMIRDANPGLIDQALIDAGIKDDPFHPPPGVSAQDVEDWKENFDDYHSPEDDFDAYHDQPVEADARDSGEQYLDDLTPEDLDHEREEAR
ncbi:MAG: hypothetical protein JWO76_1196, partial [Nocardioides sp.]|nr:hypothetical protein [Nocardioides sp.]